jgi:hypothetical protein
MQKLTYLIIAVLLSSCGWHVFENGHRIPGPLPTSQGDSILTLSLSNLVPVPDSAVVISHLVIKAPFQKILDYASIESVARHEAVRVGGNLMKVDTFHAIIHTKWLRQGIYVAVYRLNATDLARLRIQLDSADRHYADSIKDMAIVHIRDRDQQGKRVVYFNDSMVATIHGVGFDGVRNPGRKDLVFGQSGVLRFDPEPPVHLDIKVGKEYFIVLSSTATRHGYHYIYQLVDKEHFYYKML